MEQETLICNLCVSELQKRADIFRSGVVGELLTADDMAKLCLIFRKGLAVWYVVWVQTGQEEKTKDMCLKLFGESTSDNGVPIFEECFIPMREKAWRANGGWSNKVEILFPGYLFFISDDYVALNTALRGIPQFAKILGDNDGPIPLRQHEIDFLIKFTNKEHIVEMSIADIIGDKLVVASGPMQDYEGRVVHIDRRKRECTLEVEFFGRITQVKVGLAVVKKIG